MKILLLGKYPPIQGGESAKIYWLAKSLGERGHSIYIVSNCMEVEDTYRCQLNDEDKEKLQPKNVTLKSTIPVGMPVFIPQNNPYSEKLTSLGLDIANELNPDLIFSWYLLPYSIAGFNISKIIGKKHIIRHAGSDITRLFNHPYLSSFLRNVIKESDGIFTYSGLEGFFESLGCKSTYTVSSGFPDEFNPSGEKTNLKNTFNLEINPERTLLFLGKINKPKGISYLINAFAKTNKDNYLVIAGDGPYKKICEDKISELGLEDRIHFLGTLAPWKIPLIIRTVKAVVVPEYNFGVPIHQSSTPYEALLCGKTPIVSKEIESKYEELSDYFITIDPTNTKNFAKALEDVLKNENLNNNVIKDYPKIRNYLGDFNQYVEKMENLLIEATS